MQQVSDGQLNRGKVETTSCTLDFSRNGILMPQACDGIIDALTMPLLLSGSSLKWKPAMISV